MMKIATLLVFAASFASASTAQADTTANLGSFAYYGAHHKFSESRAARPVASASTAPAAEANQMTVLTDTNLTGSAGSTTLSAPLESGNSNANSNASANANSNSNSNSNSGSSNSNDNSGGGGISAVIIPSQLTPFHNEASQDLASLPGTSASDALSAPGNSDLLAPNGIGGTNNDLGQSGQNDAIGAAADIPEPATPALIVLALAGLALRKKAASKNKA